MREFVIYCAKCKKPVERTERFRDAFAARDRFRVYCHGEEDNAFLEDADILRSENIQGVAFQINRLANAQLQEETTA